MTTYDALYCYPGTDGVLKNNLGIRDADALAEAEAIIVAAAMRNGLREPFEYSPDGLKAVHRQMFEALYPFAGEFRSVNLDKIGEDGRPEVSFAPGHLIERVEVPRFFNDLRKDFEEHKSFDNLDTETFAYRAAVYMADLNYLHPFPEGNGRVQRVLLEQMAVRSGHNLRHESIDRDQWREASIDSFSQDQYGARGQPIQLGPHEKMTALIANAARAAEAEKMRQAPPASLADDTGGNDLLADYRDQIEQDKAQHENEHDHDMTDDD